MTKEKAFPVLHPPVDCPKFIKWSALNEEWAKKIHSQTLERLAERGGLCYEEILINVKRLQFLDEVDKQEAIKLVKELQFFESIKKENKINKDNAMHQLNDEQYAEYLKLKEPKTEFNVLKEALEKCGIKIELVNRGNMKYISTYTKGIRVDFNFNMKEKFNGIEIIR